MSLSQVGATHYSNTEVDEVAVQVVAGSVLVFNVWVICQTSTSLVYLQMFDALEADVTVGTTEPNVIIPAVLAPTVISLTCPLAFRTGIVIAATATPSGNDSPSDSVVVSIDYVGG